MQVEYYGPKGFEGFVNELCQIYSVYYDKKDPVKICAGDFTLFSNGRVKVRPIGRLNKALTFIENYRKQNGRVVPKQQRKLDKRLLSELEIATKLSNRYRLKNNSALLHPLYGAIILNLDSLLAGSVSNLGLSNSGRGPSELLESQEVELCHELVHSDTHEADFFRTSIAFALEGSGRMFSATSQQIYNDDQGYSGSEITRTGFQTVLQGGEDLPDPREMHPLVKKYFEFSATSNRDHISILDEALAHAVEKKLFSRTSIEPDPNLYYPDHPDSPHAAEYRQLLTQAYQRLCDRITDERLIKPTIQETKQIMDQAFDQNRSPLELMSLI